MDSTRRFIVVTVDVAELPGDRGSKALIICDRLTVRTTIGWMLAAYIGAMGAKFTYDVVHDHPHYAALVEAVRKNLP
jgi:hypothetical protein